MPRTPRVSPVGIPQHVIQRGNNRQICFASQADFAAYAKWLGEATKRYQVQLHAWVFMTNHVHLLVTPQQESALSQMMQALGSRYVQYFNSTYKRTGTLWEGRFRSCLVHSEHYFLACQRYIELNPVRAKMVNHPAIHRWSSYQINAHGLYSPLWTPHATYLALGENPIERQKAYRALFNDHQTEDTLRFIRDSINKGLALGNDRFRIDMEKLTGIKQTPGKPGRKWGSEPD